MRMNMEDDSLLLKKQLKVTYERLCKLGEHKKSVELKLKNIDLEKDREFLLETMKRLDDNLLIEYKRREGILKVMNSKNAL